MARKNRNQSFDPYQNDLRLAAVPFVPEALATIVNVMRNSPREEHRLKAAESLLDRVYGKPVGSSSMEQLPFLEPTNEIEQPVEIELIAYEPQDKAPAKKRSKG